MKAERYPCLYYWLRVNGRMALALAAINAAGIVAHSYTALIMAAFFAGSCTDTFFHGTFGGKGTELLLSLPFSRREIWRTHGLTAGVFYGLLALLACVTAPLFSASTLLALFVFILSHLICAIQYRYPGASAFIILMGFLLFVIAMIYTLLRPGFLVALEHDTRFLAAFAAVDAALLAGDVCLWLREGRRFVKGGVTDGK